MSALSETMRETLDKLLEAEANDSTQEGSWVTPHYTVGNIGTLEALERRSLIETEAADYYGTVWRVRLTDEGRKEARR